MAGHVTHPLASVTHPLAAHSGGTGPQGPAPVCGVPRPARGEPQPAGEEPQPAGEEPQPAGEEPPPPRPRAPPLKRKARPAPPAVEEDPMPVMANSVVFPKGHGVNSPLPQPFGAGPRPPVDAPAVRGEPRPAGGGPQPAGEEPQPAGEERQPAGEEQRGPMFDYLLQDGWHQFYENSGIGPATMGGQVHTREAADTAREATDTLDEEGDYQKHWAPYTPYSEKHPYSPNEYGRLPIVEDEESPDLAEGSGRDDLNQEDLAQYVEPNSLRRGVEAEPM